MCAHAPNIASDRFASFRLRSASTQVSTTTLTQFDLILFILFVLSLFGYFVITINLNTQVKVLLTSEVV